MSVILEVVHTVSPGWAQNFERYVETYSKFAIPTMDECGMKVAGAWRWCTGQPNRDLLIVPYDSVVAQSQASEQLQIAIAAGRVEGLMTLGLGIEEVGHYGQILPYATPERLEAVRRGNGNSPRHFLYSLQKSPLAMRADAIEAMAKLDDALTGEGIELVTAYALTSGERGRFVHIWALEDPEGELAFRSTAEQFPALAELRGMLSWETIDYLEPLPYSRLQ